MKIKFNKLDPNATLPVYATAEAAGMDVCALRDGWINRQNWGIIETGLSVDIPKGYELQVRPRSGLAAKHGVSVLNSPGTIDSDYEGEIKVILVNHGQTEFFYSAGDRIAQLVLAKVFRADEARVIQKERGVGGFGSSGT